MSEIVNLNRARKARARSERQAQAAENRARFGRSKAEKRLEAARAGKLDRDLAGHRRRDDKGE